MENEIFEETFWSIYNDECTKLMKKNKEYKEMQNKCCEIVESSPNIRKVLDDGDPASITEEESKKIIEYNELMDNRNIIESKALLLAGAKYYHKLLVCAGIIKK